MIKSALELLTKTQDKQNKAKQNQKKWYIFTCLVQLDLGKPQICRDPVRTDSSTHQMQWSSKTNKSDVDTFDNAIFCKSDHLAYLLVLTVTNRMEEQ